MSMKAIEEYNRIKVVCSKCGEELDAIFNGESCSYVCKECGETKVSSEKYWNFKDYYEEKRVESKINEVVVGISSFVNSYDVQSKEFAERMGKQHRTLQQSFTGLCLDWFRYLASLSENQYDGRNEASVKLAKEIMNKVEGANYKLPMI